MRYNTHGGDCMKKLFSVLICVAFMLFVTACEGISISNKRFDEISNYVLDNFETLSSEKEIEFFDYETTGLSIGGVYYGYYFSAENELSLYDGGRNRFWVVPFVHYLSRFYSNKLPEWFEKSKILNFENNFKEIYYYENQ